MTQNITRFEYIKTFILGNTKNIQIIITYWEILETYNIHKKTNFSNL